MALLDLFYETSPYEGFDVTQHPDDLQGWGSTAPIFEEVMVKLKPKVIIEVGTWKGASAIHLAKLARKHGLDTQIICVDTWLGSPEHFLGHMPSWRESLRIQHGYPRLYFTFLANVIRQNCVDAIIPLPATAEGAARILRNKKIAADLIYIDGDHSFDAVLHDLRTYWSLLSPRGVLIGDDYTNENGVVRAARQFATEINRPITEGTHAKFAISRSDR